MLSVPVPSVAHVSFAVASPLGRQATFDELGTPLHAVTFVVVDLETTGGSPADCSITEVGAVKTRAGEVLGEFHSLVNPGAPIPAFIQVLTGISDAMVAAAPPESTVLPAFLEFAAGSVLVAHNAPFDVGFLKAAAARLGYPWPAFGVLDTARLARQLVLRDEAPDCRLSSLARVFHARVTPNHRALDDARATVDVLHGLIERVGTQGVDTLEELTTYSARVSPVLRRKRHLADGLPHRPGVYLFEDSDGRTLYIGKATDLATRVRSYFTASEMRTRMAEMVGLAERVRHIPCPTLVEAEVRELRLIAQHQPPYNRRSRFPDRVTWLKLTAEAFPRLSLVRSLADDAATYLGPFGSRRQAEAARDALQDALPLRRCTGRLRPDPAGSACALAEMGRCAAPCLAGSGATSYPDVVQQARAAMTGDVRGVVAHAQARVDALAGAQRYEEAAEHRDRLAALLAASGRMHRLAALSGCEELVAERGLPDATELVVVRHGRLAASDRVPPGAASSAVVDAVVATAESVQPGRGPTPASSAEELEVILRWLDQPQVRLLALEGTWASPVHGGGREREQWAGRRAVVAAPSSDRRRLRPRGAGPH